MPRHTESQAGAFSGLLAIIMIVALSMMALTALTPARDPPMRVADLVVPLPEILPPPGIVPRAG